MKKIALALLFVSSLCFATDYPVQIVPFTMLNHVANNPVWPYGPIPFSDNVPFQSDDAVALSVVGQSLVKISESGKAHAVIEWHLTINSVDVFDVGGNLIASLVDTPFQEQPVSCRGSFICHPWLTDDFVGQIPLTPGGGSLQIQGTTWSSNHWLDDSYTVSAQ